MSGFRLRTATRNDREFCWWLLQQTMKPYIAATWGWNDAEQLTRFEAEFDPASRQIVEFDGRAIGVLHANYGSDPVRVLNLQICPAFQGRGIGTRVIREVILRANGRAVWLQVLKDNPAKAFYERHGFRVSKENATHREMILEPMHPIG